MVPDGEDGGREVAQSARKFADGNLAKEIADEKVHSEPRNPGAIGRDTAVALKQEVGQEQRGLPRT